MKIVEDIMQRRSAQVQANSARLIDMGVIFVSLELSKSRWLVTSLAPGMPKMSHFIVEGGDVAANFFCFSDLRDKSQARMGKIFTRLMSSKRPDWTDFGSIGFSPQKPGSKAMWLTLPQLRSRVGTDEPRRIALMAKR